MAAGLAIQQLRDNVGRDQHGEPCEQRGSQKVLPNRSWLAESQSHEGDAQQQQESMLDKRERQHALIGMHADPVFHGVLEELQRRKIAGAQPQRFHVQNLHNGNEAQQDTADGSG